MKNQCKIHARKSDAKHMENHPQMSSKGDQKPSRNLSKIGSKKRSKKKKEMPEKPGGALSARGEQLSKTKEQLTEEKQK